MTRVIATVLGGLMLSGCALPVPLQIASWALDGFSLLTTQKSITDHGISMVAQQDCALWRGVTEGEVCRETDPMAIMVAQGDVVPTGEDAQGETGTSAFQSLLKPTPEPVVEADTWAVETANVVETNDTTEIVPDTTVTEADVVDEAPTWQLVSQEPETVVAEAEELASYHASPGDYFVIGSFGVWDNAKGFALKHQALDARVLAANVADYRVFRIVVGPYNADNRTTLRSDIRDAEVTDVWAVRVPADAVTVAWRMSDTVTEVASVNQAD